MERKKIILYKDPIASQELKKITGICPSEFLTQLNIKEPISLEDLKTLSEFMEFNFVSPFLSPTENLEYFLKSFPSSKKKVVVSIMGHVNHGKTTLIDQIRNTKVAHDEAGGITQNVSFYKIKHQNLEFILIDTPGHAAFSEMRQNIAKISDIIILLVAADDGVKEQTIEIAKHINQKNIILCINKIDKGEKNLPRIYSDLANCHIVSNHFGGEVATVSISAQKKQGIQELLDTVCKEIDKKQLKNDVKRLAVGIVLDATIKEGIGILVEVIFRDGIAKTKDYFLCENKIGRIKSIFYNNQQLNICNSVEIVSIVGFDEVPTIGSEIFIIPDISFRDFFPENISSVSKIHSQEHNFICKSDQELKLKTLVEVMSKYGNIIHSSIGVLKQTELEQAKNFKATVIFWQKMPNAFLTLLSQFPEVKYISDEVIYKIQETIEKNNEKPQEDILEEIGKLKIIKTFLIKGKKIAGCKVISGKALIGSTCAISREGNEIMRGKIDSLQREKQDIDEARKGSECGIILKIEKSTVDSFQEEDEITVFEKK